MPDLPQLFLISPPLTEPAGFAPLLERALQSWPAACVFLDIATTDEGEAKRIIQALAPPSQDAGAAVLIPPPHDWRQVARWGADGVHVADPSRAEAALEALKPDRIVGFGGLKSRDVAMSLGEGGADYVMFGEPRPDGTLPPLDQVTERCQWWAELFNVPCVGYAPDLAAVTRIAGTGAEFIGLGFWAFDATGATVAEARRLISGR